MWESENIFNKSMFWAVCAFQNYIVNKNQIT